MNLPSLRTSLLITAMSLWLFASSAVSQTERRPAGLIKAGPVFSLPNGDFFYKTEGGIGFGADLFVSVGRNSFLGVRITRTGIGWDRDALTQGGYYPASIEEVQAWSLIGVYRYERALTDAADGRLRGAVDAGLGVINRARGALHYGAGGPGSEGGFPLEKGNATSMAVIHMGGELIYRFSGTMGLSLEAAVENGLLTRIVNPVIEVQADPDGNRPIETGSLMHLSLRWLVWIN